MSHKIKENMEELQAEIKKLCMEPVTYRSAERIVICHKAYKIMCEMCDDRDRKRNHDDAYKLDVAVTNARAPKFDRKMALAWTSGMQNADGTKGPHWSMEQTNKVMQDYKVECDPVEFWVVMNSIYSDYCEALKKNNASMLETYVCLAQAWINDKDAVSDKAAAYFTYVVEH